MQTQWLPPIISARLASSSARQVLSRLTYDSFGNLVNVPAIVPTFTFTGFDFTTVTVIR